DRTNITGTDHDHVQKAIVNDYRRRECKPDLPQVAGVGNHAGNAVVLDFFTVQGQLVWVGRELARACNAETVYARLPIRSLSSRDAPCTRSASKPTPARSRKVWSLTCPISTCRKARSSPLTRAQACIRSFGIPSSTDITLAVPPGNMASGTWLPISPLA